MLNLNPAKETKRIVSFIRLVCKREKIKHVLVAVSGGVDSATSLALAVRALDLQYVHPVLLPYGKLNDEGTHDALGVIKAFKIPSAQCTKIDITPFVDNIIKYDPSMDEVRKGNVMARIRMVILYDLSKKLNCLVIGTENKTEHLLGYYTRFGDEASDIEPIRGLYKTQVYLLAAHLKVPQKILSKSPTAGLWKGQTDEGEFGFSYTFADEVLYLFKDKHVSKKRIIAKGYDKNTVNRLWWWIDKGEFKDRLPHASF